MWRVLTVVAAGIAFIGGFVVWNDPAQWSGADTGDAIECEADVCVAYDYDFDSADSGGESTKKARFTGTLAEVEGWSDKLNREAARPVVIGLFAAGAGLLLVTLAPWRWQS